MNQFHSKFCSKDNLMMLKVYQIWSFLKYNTKQHYFLGNPWMTFSTSRFSDFLNKNRITTLRNVQKIKAKNYKSDN